MSEVEKIEAVVTAIIYNGEKVLYIQDPKWNNSWTYPGGHIEYGEKIFEAALRETNEEVGLAVDSLTPEAIVDYGEKISSKEFHRAAHFIYFTVVCKSSSTAIKINKDEVTAYKWLAPEQALKELNLGTNDTKSTKKFIEYLK